jgi:peptidoglycan/LPS O-acetylase OafA/YrhL
MDALLSVVALIASFLAAALVWYAGEDELERQRFERSVKQKPNRGGE